MFVVSSPASETNLTTLEAIKTDLNITTATEDDYLELQIGRVSAAICTYLDVSTASDGSRTLGRETCVETLRNLDKKEITLSRYPVVSVASIYENDVLLDPSVYEVDGSNGILRRFEVNGCERRWCFRKLVVTYTAGWLLPGEAGTTLPADIQEAAISLIKTVRFNRTRDPLLRSENILESLYSYTLFSPSDTPSGLPATVSALLEPYRNISVS